MEKKFLNEIEFETRWVDMDAYQHINNARYFDAASEARVKLFNGIRPEDMPCQIVLVESSCNFKRPFFHPDFMLVKQYLLEIGRASFTLEYEFYSKNHPGIIHAEAFAKMVCYDSVKKKAIGIPEVILQVLHR